MKFNSSTRFSSLYLYWIPFRIENGDFSANFKRTHTRTSIYIHRLDVLNDSWAVNKKYMCVCCMKYDVCSYIAPKPNLDSIKYSYSTMLVAEYVCVFVLYRCKCALLPMFVLALRRCEATEWVFPYSFFFLSFFFILVSNKRSVSHSISRVACKFMHWIAYTQQTPH